MSLTLDIELIKLDPIIAPLEYLHALLKVFLSDIPNPIIVGLDKLSLFIFLKYSIWFFENSLFFPVIDEDDTTYINPLEIESISFILSSEVLGLTKEI